MEGIVKKLPTWLILAIACYVAVLVSYAMFDNQRSTCGRPRSTRRAYPRTLHRPNASAYRGSVSTRQHRSSLRLIVRRACRPL
jgi:hypothetical protein